MGTAVVGELGEAEKKFPPAIAIAGSVACGTAAMATLGQILLLDEAGSTGGEEDMVVVGTA